MDVKNVTITESKVRAATIFTDRAQVTRSASVDLKGGEHTFIFDTLPTDIDANSIQVTSNSNAILKDVQFKCEYHTEIPNEEIKKYSELQQEFQDELSALGDKIEQVNNEKEFIQNISLKLTASTEETQTSLLDPDKWLKMVEFYRTKLMSLDQETRDAEQEIRITTEKLEALEHEIRVKGNTHKERRKVEVVLDNQQQPGEYMLELSYIVYGPSWRPYYDIRVSSDNKVMNITYNANITQNTSEDWEDVSIKLSTAQANVSGTQPELSPWRVSQHVAPPVLATRSAPSVSRQKSKKEEAPEVMEQMFESQMMSEESLFPDEPFAASALESPETIVETKATSVVFSISGTTTIESDNSEHKATILIDEFPATFRYSCVPKLTPYAYLKAEVKNTTDYPFLAGPTNIFLDNNFVGNAEMDLIASSEKFWTFLGVDEAMKVEHKFLKRNVKQGGMFNKSNSYTYEYKIEITNNKKTNEDIVVWDQLPISNNTKIEVKLITPEYKEDTADLKMNEFKYIEWFFKSESGVKIEIPLKFSIEYPADMTIEGV